MPEQDVVYWATRPEWISLWGTLAGAVIGGVISAWVGWLTAVKSAREQARLHAEERAHQARVRQRELKEVERGLAFKFLIRVSLIASNYINVFKHINEQIRANDSPGMEEFLFSKIMPTIGQLPRQNLAPEEIAVFYKADEVQLMNDTVEVFIRHDTFLDALEKYNELRMDLKNYMPMTEIRGSVIASALNEEQRRNLMPRFLELESLIQGIYSGRDDYLKETASLCERIGPAGRKYWRRQVSAT